MSVEVDSCDGTVAVRMVVGSRQDLGWIGDGWVVCGGGG